MKSEQVQRVRESHSADPVYLLRKLMSDMCREQKCIAPQPDHPSSNPDDWYSSVLCERVAISLGVPYWPTFQGWLEKGGIPTLEQADALEKIGGPPAWMWRRKLSQFHEFLFEWMRMLSHTPTTLGAKLGVSAKSVAEWLNGTAKPNLAAFNRLGTLGFTLKGLREQKIESYVLPLDSLQIQARREAGSGRIPLVEPQSRVADRMHKLAMMETEGRCQCISHQIYYAASDYEDLGWESRRSIVRQISWDSAPIGACSVRVPYVGPHEARDISIVVHMKPAKTAMATWINTEAWLTIVKLESIAS